jgi:repressor LexA
MSLTPRMKDTLDYIVEFQVEKGYSPTFREIADGIGVSSTSRVQVLVNALKDRGYIMTRAGGRRMIDVLRTTPMALQE